MQPSQPTFGSLGLSPLIDQRCDAFEWSWKSGQRPRIEEFLLELNDSDRAVLLRELLLLEDG